MIERKKLKNALNGFSMVELVITIVLVGILGAVVISRFLSGNAFNPLAIRDAVISIERAAQQASLGRNNVSFEIDASGGEWLLTAREGASVIRTMSVSTNGVNLETGSAVASVNTCANSYDTAVANDFELDFDSRGNLTSFTNNSTTEIVNAAFNGVRICVNDDVNLSVCVSPAGFAYEGNCDD